MEEPNNVPNPQSGRNAKSEDETKREESIQQQYSDSQLSSFDGSGGSLSGPIDEIEAVLVDPIQGLYIGGPGGGHANAKQSFAPPGKLFVGGISGKTTTRSLTDYFAQVSLFVCLFVCVVTGVAARDLFPFPTPVGPLVPFSARKALLTAKIALLTAPLGCLSLPSLSSKFNSS